MSKPALGPIAIAISLVLTATYGVDAILDHPKLTGIDDANIFFVYARNIAAGHGYVFIPGFERVEGGTSILWTLICAASFFLTSNPLTLLLLISLGLCAGAVYTSIRIYQLLAAAHDVSDLDARLVLVFCVIGYAGLPDFYLWNSITLMDAALWVLAVQLLVLFPLRDNLTRFSRTNDPVAFAITVGLASLVRPESLALIPGVIFLAIICAATSVGWGRALHRYRAAIASFVLFQIGLALFRSVYFGDPVPNTYYAKTSGDFLHTLKDGFDYLLSYLIARPGATTSLLLSIGCVALLGAKILPRRGMAPPAAADRAAFIVSAVFVGGTSLPLLTGGDHFGSHRFFQPYALLAIIPPAHLMLLLLARWRDARPARQRRALCALGILLVSGIGIASWTRFESDNNMWHEFYLARHGIATGEAIAGAIPTEPLPSIGVVAAGGLGYGHRGQTLDLLGMNWKAMAHSSDRREGMRGHSAFRRKVFWTRPPDLVVPTLLRSEPTHAGDIIVPFDSLVLHNLFATPPFRRAYIPGQIQTEAGWLSGFFLRNWLKRNSLESLVIELPWGPPAEVSKK